MTDPILQNISKIKSNRIILLGFLFTAIYLFNINITSANTGINPQIPYSGTIVKNDGTVLEGSYRAKFILYNASSAGTVIYEEIRDGVTNYAGTGVSPLLSVSDGRFEILLGSQNTTITTINDDSLWLELQLDMDNNGSYEEIFAPRKRIGSALSAINSMRLVANGGVSTNTLSLDSIGNLVFTGDSAIERMRILGTGNVGIGTTTPGSALDIRGTLRLSGSTSGFVGFAPAAAAGGTTYTLPSADGTSNQVLSTNGSGVLSWISAGSASGWSLTGNSGTNPTSNYIGTSDAQALSIRTNATERINIAANGGMSLTAGSIATSGTTAPGVNITGGDNTSGASSANTNGGSVTITGGATTAAGSSGASRGGNLTLVGGSGNTNNASSGGDIEIFSGNAASSGNRGSVRFGVGGLTTSTGAGTLEVMRIDSAGNVGIGMTNPSRKLDVTGTFGVTGVTTLGSTLGVTGLITGSGGATITGTTNINTTGSSLTNIGRVVLSAGTATANTAPLKFTAGTNLTIAEAGAVEWNGTNLFLTTSGGVRQTINQGLTATATLDFASTNNGSFTDLTVTVTGANLNDVVSLGIPNGSVPAANSNFTAWVSAANTVTVRFNNNSGVAQDPASGSFKVFVTKF